MSDGVRTDDDGFSEFVRSSSRSLLRTAWLLTGDFATAEDLVQAALAHTWPRWRRLRSRAAAGAYVRQVMIRTFLRWQSRRWSGEVATDPLPDRASAVDEIEQTATRQVLATAVRNLPAGQRAVVVLRYFDDLSEAETARALGCSVGTVKSQTARALRALRATPSVQSAVSGEWV